MGADSSMDLSQAVQSNSWTRFSTLLHLVGTDANQRDSFGHTPLYWAILLDNEDMAGKLIMWRRWAEHRKYGDRNVMVDLSMPVDNEGSGNTPLHFAAELGRLPIVKILLFHMADINARNVKNQQPLDIATDEEVKRVLQEEFHDRPFRSMTLDLFNAAREGNLRSEIM